MEEVAIIVGAGPAGLAISACLNVLSIPNIVLEREDCSASLWKKHTYDRIKLHLAKQFCNLPHMPFPRNAPTFVSKKGFIEYLDEYVSRFNINPRFHRLVESATYDGATRKWHIMAGNRISGQTELYICRFLVVATGENSEGLIPTIEGLDRFGGEILHSSEYKNGGSFAGKDVLVVGCANSGMEVAYDLSNWGARTSMVARSPTHVFSKELIFLGMVLLKFLPRSAVDCLIVRLSKLKYGDVSKYGLQTPKEGPFYLKATTGRSPVIDVGAMEKIKKGEIKVFPAISSISKNEVIFANGYTQEFDAILFATGYRSTTRNWLKGGEDLFDEDGMPDLKNPSPWKGNCGLYCVGFGRKGLSGISSDAQNVAADINMILKKS